MSRYLFKTVYFPRDKVASGKPARITVSFAAGGGDAPLPEYLARIRGMSSRELRLLLGDPLLEQLERQAETEKRSLSNLILRLLLERDSSLDTTQPQQLSLLSPPSAPRDRAPTTGQAPGLTFKESRRQKVHGWYPYVEGFSATYARDAILRYGASSVFDPFGGAGTTQVTASHLGIPSSFCEVNPFMSFVAETKVASAAWAHSNQDLFGQICADFIKSLDRDALKRRADAAELGHYRVAFPNRDFFAESDLRELLAARELACLLADGYPHARALLLLACAANAVRSSHMTRRADLRRRRPDEYKTRVVDVGVFIIESVARIRDDVAQLPPETASTSKLGTDCRTIPELPGCQFDMALTSPPYLNGTNYFRNTKLELWYLGFIDSEKDLRHLRETAIRAGINTISKRNSNFKEIPEVEKVVRELDRSAMDARIPMMVRGYFSDMYDALLKIRSVLAPEAPFILDIGDSRFYGVNVPTHELLATIAEEVGFRCEAINLLAHRYSYDKTELSQVELVLRRT